MEYSQCKHASVYMLSQTLIWQTSIWTGTTAHLYTAWRFPCSSQISPYVSRVESGINAGIFNLRGVRACRLRRQPRRAKQRPTRRRCRSNGASSSCRMLHPNKTGRAHVTSAQCVWNSSFSALFSHIGKITWKILYNLYSSIIIWNFRCYFQISRRCRYIRK